MLNAPSHRTTTAHAMRLHLPLLGLLWLLHGQLALCEDKDINLIREAVEQPVRGVALVNEGCYALVGVDLMRLSYRGTEKMEIEQKLRIGQSARIFGPSLDGHALRLNCGQEYESPLYVDLRAGGMAVLDAPPPDSTFRFMNPKHGGYKWEEQYLVPDGKYGAHDVNARIRLPQIYADNAWALLGHTLVWTYGGKETSGEAPKDAGFCVAMVDYEARSADIIGVSRIEGMSPDDVLLLSESRICIVASHIGRSLFFYSLSDGALPAPITEAISFEPGCDVIAENGRVYLLDGDYLVCVDATEGQVPTAVHRQPCMVGPGRYLNSTGHYLIVHGSGAIRVFEISGSGLPEYRESYTPDVARIGLIERKGRYIYALCVSAPVNLSESGMGYSLRIYSGDASKGPRELGRCSLPSGGNGWMIGDNMATIYLNPRSADGGERPPKSVVIDISDPAHPGISARD